MVSRSVSVSCARVRARLSVNVHALERALGCLLVTRYLLPLVDASVLLTNISRDDASGAHSRAWIVLSSLMSPSRGL